MTRVNLYLRQSLDATGEGIAVARQEAECRDYAATHGLTIADVFTDNDVSATTGRRRPGFEALLSSKLDILVWHQDRLLRVSRDLERVLDAGMNVHTVRAGTLDLSNPTGRAVARTVTAWATYEGEHKAERQRAQHRQRAAQGRPWWPVRPFGLHRDGTLHPDEAPALAQAYRDLLAGHSLASLAARLNDAGLPTPRGGAWRGPALRLVLLNPRNAAILAHNGVEVGPATWDAVIDEPTYRAACAMLKAPGRFQGGGGARQALLTGVARCSVCLAPVRVGWRGRKGQDGARAVYACKGSSHVSAPVEGVDRFVLQVVALRLTASDAGRLWARDPAGEYAALTARHAEIEQRERELAEAFATGALSVGQLTTATAVLREQRADVEAEMSRKAASSLPGQFAHPDPDVVAQRLAQAPTDTARSLVEYVCDSISLEPVGRGHAWSPAAVTIVTAGLFDSGRTLIRRGRVFESVETTDGGEAFQEVHEGPPGAP